MAIQFITKQTDQPYSSQPIFGVLDSSSAFLNAFLDVMLTKSSDREDDNIPINILFEREWGVVSVSGKTLNTAGIETEQYACPIPFIKDAAYSIPNWNGDLIYMSGWKAGITLMIIALHEFTQFGPYSSTLPMEDYYKNVISLMVKLSHADCREGVACNIKNAATCLKVLMSIVDEMAWSEVYEVLD